METAVPADAVTAVLAMLGVCPAPVCLPFLLPYACCMVPRLRQYVVPRRVCGQAATATAPTREYLIASRPSEHPPFRGKKSDGVYVPVRKTFENRSAKQNQ